MFESKSVGLGFVRYL